ncbi:MAG TPA: amino acid ABC transporter permease [Symbiobacteriaceae bacterium]|nr:amino acid ABC transporter permease [Symbiobacteriaceae bacterium]
MNGSVAELLEPHFFLFLGRGLLVTLKISATAIALSFVLGTLVGIARYSRHPILGRLAGIYVEGIRNVPLLLLILFARFVSRMSPVGAGITAMTVFTTAIIAEIVRGGLNAVDKGQWEAARSQGFSYVQTLRHIVLPQALRRMIPPLLSQFTTVIKDTSFVWVVGVEELTGKGMIILGQFGSTAQFFGIFGMIGAIYFAVNFLLSQIARRQELRFRVAG